MPKKIVFANATAVLSQPGTVFRFPVQEGLAYWADHPAVQAHPSSFSATPPRVYPLDWVSPEPAVEQATAAPGEKRASRHAD